MSFLVQDAIDQVRSVHPAFSRFMVPDKALADFFTREQQRLMALAVSRDRSYLAQSLSIVFDLANASADAPGTAGVGTSGGVPGINDNGSIAAVQSVTGSAITIADGTVSVSDLPVASATTTTLTAAGVSWTVNLYTGQLARIVAGTGANTGPREIASNTSTTITVSAAWEITPDTTSVFRVVQGLATVDSTVGAVTNLPALDQTRGYLVKLNSQGTPYIDYTAPLVADVSRGVPLPPFHAVLGGTVRCNPTAGFDHAFPLLLVSEAMPYVRQPAAFLRGQSLFLLGNACRWTDVASIELSYVPIPPAFAARTDVFLLPDAALPCITARAALFAASRITGLPGVPQAPSDLLAAEATSAEAAFLMTIANSKRARISRVQPHSFRGY